MLFRSTMFVLSSYYIRNDQRLRDPAFTKDQRYVEYTITQYNECNHVMIMDGLQVIVACIIREHNEMYGEGTKYSISFEFDRDNLVSPTIVKMLDDRDGMEPSIVRPTKPYDLQSTYIIPPSRRRLEGYLPNERGRLDIRYFATGSIERRYAGMTDLYKRYAIETREGRFEFIKSRGFEEFLSPAPIVFDIMPYALNAIESGEMIRNIQKVNIESLRDRNSEDSDNLRFKQRELEYLKELGDSPMGSFNRFMFMVADHLFDYLGKTGK